MDDMGTDRPPRPVLRLVARVSNRYAAGDRGGRRLARSVVAARTGRLGSAGRLVAGRPAPMLSAAPVVARAVAPASAPPAPPPSARPAWAPPEMTNFAAQWLFGDQDEAREGLVPMHVAETMPEPGREQRLARFLARGGLERSRGAEMLEGPAEEPAPGPAGPKRLSRMPVPASPEPSARGEAPAAPHTPTPRPAQRRGPPGSAPRRSSRPRRRPAPRRKRRAGSPGAPHPQP